MENNKEKTKYKLGDTCSHCGGNVSPHSAGAGVIYWCDDCGSNNPQSPPNVKIEYTPPTTSQREGQNGTQGLHQNEETFTIPPNTLKENSTIKAKMSGTTTTKFTPTIEGILKELEEFGQIHDNGCACMNDNDPDECNCETLKQIKDFIRKEVTELLESLKMEGKKFGEDDFDEAGYKKEGYNEAVDKINQNINKLIK